MTLDKDLTLSVLQSGKMRLEGQFVYGSNYTYLGICQLNQRALKAVYKPIQGERPLWDFPVHTLAKREVAAYLVSEALGWDLVPPTVLRNQQAPLGPGSVQLFIEHDPNTHYFNLNESDRALLPKVALFDLLINNADRKGGHLLFDPQGKLWLIDHGLSFNVEDKLRTVVWEMAGQRIPSDLLMDLEKITLNLEPEKALYEALQTLLSPEEIEALQERTQKYRNRQIFPLPPEDRRAYPWPLI